MHVTRAYHLLSREKAIGHELAGPNRYCSVNGLCVISGRLITEIRIDYLAYME